MHSFGNEYIPKETKTFIGNLNIVRNVYRMQKYNWIICGYFCIGLIDFNQNELMCKKHKNVCGVLNYIEHLLVLVSAATGYSSISAFAYVIGIPASISSSAVGLKICVITAGIKSIIKKKKKKYDQIALLGTSK